MCTRSKGSPATQRSHKKRLFNFRRGLLRVRPPGIRYLNVRLAWRVCGKSGFPAHLAVFEAGAAILNARRANGTPKTLPTGPPPVH